MRPSQSQTLAEGDLLVSPWYLLSMQKSWPLRWPTPAEIPSSPKKRYPSAYVNARQVELADPAQILIWKQLSDFDLLLRLVDFNGLRPVLAHLLGWQSGRGWKPFDPVSFFFWSPGKLPTAGSAVRPSKTWLMSVMPMMLPVLVFAKGSLPLKGG